VRAGPRQGSSVPSAQGSSSPSDLSEAHREFEHVRTRGDIHEFVLTRNGLTVLLKNDVSAPVVTVVVTYRVGSANEANGNTGSTHMLEHLMFKGSKRYNKENGRPIWDVLQSVGAVLNATTWKDRTSYFEILPAEFLGEALNIEADRMRDALLRGDDLLRERTVVKNEFENDENDNFAALDKAMWSTAFHAHPYSHPTIGWKHDLENASIESLRNFYGTFYHPNNATLTVFGDLGSDFGAVLETIFGAFGQIPQSPKAIPQVTAQEPAQWGERRVCIRKPGEQTIVYMGHKTPGALDPDSVPLYLLSKVLSETKTSRLYRSLVDPGRVTSLFSWNSFFRYPGLFCTAAFLAPQEDPQAVEQKILEAYEDVITNGVSEDELGRVKAIVKASVAFSMDETFGMANTITEYIAAGDWAKAVDFQNEVQQVRSEDLKRVAEAYLRSAGRTVGVFIPDKTATPSFVRTCASSRDPASPKQPGPEGNATVEEGDKQVTERWVAPLGTPPPNLGHSQAKPSAWLSQRLEQQRPLGDDSMTLTTYRTTAKDVVTIMGCITGGDEHSSENPWNNSVVADFATDLMSEGTRNKNKFEIAETLESMGARIALRAGTRRLRFSLRCLKQDLSRVVALLAEQLQEPRFDEADLNSLRTRFLGEIDNARESPSRAAEELFSTSMYPRGHTNFLPSLDELARDAQGATVDKVRSFHQTLGLDRHVQVIAVGDVDAGEVGRLFRENFSGWQRSKLSLPRQDHKTALQIARPGVRKFAQLVEKKGLEVNIGQPLGFSYDHVDHYAFAIGLFILGGNFSSRLMQTVRDKRGLTYGISSAVEGMDEHADGYWRVNATFGADAVRQGIACTMDVIERWRQDGVTAEELETKKKTMYGSYQVNLSSTQGVAAQVLSNLQRGRDLGYIDRFPEIVNDLKLSHVNEAITKYASLDNVVITCAGTYSGNPLKD